MKWLLTIAFFVIANVAGAQTSFVKEAAAKLDRALLKKDTTQLKQLLHKDLTYGHSNGWIENRQEMITHLVNGKLSYNRIESSDTKWKAGKDWASMRCTTFLAYTLDGQPGELKLHVLQFWIKTNKGWQLIARQSTKIQGA